MFGSICPCGIEGFAWLDKREIFVLSDSTCVYERAGQWNITALEAALWGHGVRGARGWLYTG